MKAARTIAARLARLLVRIARRLDGAAGTAPAPAAAEPPHLAALRQRYPEAPPHWLEAVARRSIAPEPAAPPALGPEHEPEAPPVAASEHRETPPPELPVQREAAPAAIPQPAMPPPAVSARNVSVYAAPRKAGRPAVRFPAPKASRRQAASAARPTARPSRPAIAIRPARPGPRCGNPLFASPLPEPRREDRAPVFPARRPRAAVVDPPPPPARPQTTAKPLVFPIPDAPIPTEATALPEAMLQEAPPTRSEPGFPDSRPQASRDEPAWPAVRVEEASRPFPRFGERREEWPALPPLPDEDPAPSHVGPDEALRAEHEAGTWSA